jgi:hypothetical protein
MCVVRMDNEWIGLDTALQVQALLFGMQLMMWTGLLLEGCQAVQQLGECFCRAAGMVPWGRRACGRDGRSH